MKVKFFILLLSITGIMLYSCSGTGKTYIDELDKREDGRYYKAGEDKPFTGIVISSIFNGEWEFRSGKEIRATSFYENGKKRHETFNKRGPTQYYSPDGNPISQEEYIEKYTPSKGYKD